MWRCATSSANRLRPSKRDSALTRKRSWTTAPNYTDRAPVVQISEVVVKGEATHLCSESAPAECPARQPVAGTCSISYDEYGIDRARLRDLARRDRVGRGARGHHHGHACPRHAGDLAGQPVCEESTWYAPRPMVGFDPHHSGELDDSARSLDRGDGLGGVFHVERRLWQLQCRLLFLAQ